MSDVFRLLAGGGGGARFDKRRFADDVSIFTGAPATDAAAASSSSSKAGSSSGTKLSLPADLDFFGGASAQPATAAGKAGDAKGKGKAKPEADSGTATEPLTRATVGAFLKEHRLKLTGTDAPLPLASWAELSSRWNAPEWLAQAPAKAGFAAPTPVQCAASAVLLDDRDLLAGAPTGSGKTMAYLIPLLHHLRGPKPGPVRALIVAPTRELATQIHDQLRKISGPRGVRACVLTKANEGNLKQGEGKKGIFDVLITTPMRLVNALEAKEVDLSGVRHLVLDEADRLLEEGFLEQTDAVLAACSHPELRKALFSATLPAGVEEMARTFMVDAVRVIVGTKDAANESINQTLTYVGSEEGKLHALRALVHEGKLKPPALLFVQSIARARELFQELVYDGLHVDVIHGERPRAQRDAVVDAFKRGDVWVLICTELLARGIDFKGVRLVINYDFPQSTQAYIHRIGRSGRAGRQGEAITFYTKDDAPHLRSIANIMKNSGAEVPEWMLSLKKSSQNARNKLKRQAPERIDVRVAAGSTLGRKTANKRADMVRASKRRTAAAASSEAPAQPGEQEAPAAPPTKTKKRKLAAGAAAEES
ncbi:P-loop containing nucleoside triphosphate hydrolase protein [Tilletiopsis washingtonensis]|uniref:RNA helicase n=1 Tax=Tilletiopsis washingtonensis TaxID=58919 RepID=A0A316ZKN2_9BASI|nr:P-loop containing nucleoside triphosphate hydrolase protein [Tilletiopsis washingtonensis]PWO00874.1 P-loop containing nucleoside triphosphate hydrolase protein [Tilletiopsis washingtonensis]